MKGWVGLVAVALVLTGVILVAAQREERAAVAVAAVIERVEHGAINWTQGYVEAVGEAVYPSGKPRTQARLLARRGAIMDAQRNLLEIVAGVRVSAEAMMRDFEVTSDIVRTRVEGIIKGAQVVSEQDLGDSYRVTMRIPMKGELAALTHTVLTKPAEIDARLSEETVSRFSPPQVEPVVPPEPPKVVFPPLPEVSEGPFTGVIIDCRGLGVKPSMCPKIRKPDGTEVWGTVKVNREFVIEHGIVGYLRDFKDLKHPDVVARIGDRPLVLRAIGVGGKHRTDPILSDEDVQRLLQENEKYHFLDQMRVIFFIDKP
jgi:hypothetical protein